MKTLTQIVYDTMTTIVWKDDNGELSIDVFDYSTMGGTKILYALQVCLDNGTWKETNSSGLPVIFYRVGE